MKKSFYDYCIIHHKEELLKQWDNNINLVSPKEVGFGSKVKISWKCEKGHHWDDSPALRILCKYMDCPYCAHRKASSEYNLSIRYPNVLAFYDYDKNEDMPQTFMPHSSKVVWWKCEYGHHWQNKVINQIKQISCSYCNHKKASETYNLKLLYPSIAEEWDNEKNLISPEEVTPYSGKKVSWICSFNPSHKWDAIVYNRTRRSQGCNICASERKTSFPEQAIYYYIKKLLKGKECFNRSKVAGWELDIYVPELSFGIEYNGIFHEMYKRDEFDKKKKQYMQKNGVQLLTIKEDSNILGVHRKENQILCRGDSSYRYLNDVIKEVITYIQEKFDIFYTGDIDIKRDNIYIRALFINGKKENSLACKFPQIAKQWHDEANYPITAEMVPYGSGAIYTWKCEKGHIWKASPNKRTTRKYQCPFCSGHRVSNDNRLSKVYPAIAKMWADDNKGLTPDDVSYGSQKMINWKCDKGHTWQRSVKEMIRSGKCPYCIGKRLIPENSLAGRNPELLKEWDYVENEVSPWEISHASNIRAFWKCSKGHTWKARISNRTYLHRGCPYCHNRQPTKINNFETIYPELAIEWDYQKNGESKPADFLSKSNKKVWWKCAEGHSWLGSINSRVNGSNCPQCRSRYVRNMSLADDFPEVASRWNYEKNGDKSPKYYSAQSREMVWWKCTSHPHHEWYRRISHEVGSVGCPFCADFKVCKENSLAALYPNLINEWDYEKNGSLQPHDVLYKSNKKVFWVCKHGHYYTATVKQRTLGNKTCPYCG